MTHSLTSFKANQVTDYLPETVNDSRLLGRKHYYTTNDLLTLPFVSPYFAENLHSLPPLLIQCGGAEMLLDEIESFTRHAARDGVDVQLEVYNAHVHVFQMFPLVEAAMVSWERAGKWMRSLESPDEQQLGNDSTLINGVEEAATKQTMNAKKGSCIHHLSFKGIPISEEII